MEQRELVSRQSRKQRIRPSHSWPKVSGDAPPRAPLRKEDAIVRSESQLYLEGLQCIRDANSNFRKIIQNSRNWNALQQMDLLEGYRNGDFALILHIAVGVNDRMEGALASDGQSISSRNAFLILQSESLNVGGMKQGNQKDVLIRNVEIVKAPQQEVSIIRSFVRLYVGNHSFVEGGTQAVYLSAFESVFKQFLAVENRELGVTVLDIRNVLSDCACVCVVESRSNVVDSIPDNERHVLCDFCLIRAAVNKALPEIWVNLDATNVGIWQSGDNPLDIRNVFIGPFDFEGGSVEQVDHV